MQHHQLRFEKGFTVVAGNARSQAALMILAAGESAGGPDNRHQGADQWLYVIGGEGTAVVDGQPHPLRAGVLLLVERGEAHEIRNTGDGPLRTLDLYVPPAYTEAGDTLPAGEG